MKTVSISRWFQRRMRFPVRRPKVEPALIMRHLGEMIETYYGTLVDTAHDAILSRLEAGSAVEGGGSDTTGLERHDRDSSGGRACLEPFPQRLLGFCRLGSFNGSATSERHAVCIADEIGRLSGDFDQVPDVETWLIDDEFEIDGEDSRFHQGLSTGWGRWARLECHCLRNGLERKRMKGLEPSTFCAARTTHERTAAATSARLLNRAGSSPPD